jgi:hypothetical protein
LGFCYATGYFGSTNAWFVSTNALYPSVMLTTAGGSDIFVAKFDSVGDVRWASRAGGTSADLGRAIAVKAAGESFVTGSFLSSNANFGATALISAGNSDIFVAEWDANGAVLWAKRAGGTASDTGLAIALNPDGGSHVTGNFASANAAFGVTNLTPAGLADIFVARDVGVGRPRLAIALAGTGNKVILSWLTNYVGFNLQSASNLPPAAWSPVTNAQGILGTKYAVTNDVTGKTLFFRLSGP